MKMYMKAAAVALLLSLPVFGQDTPSMNGTWKITGSVSGHDLEYTCTINQKESKLSGTCKWNVGETPIEIVGEITEKKIKWSHKTVYDGQNLTIVFNTTFDNSSQLKGTIDVEPMNASGDFTAKKEEPQKTQ